MIFSHKFVAVGKISVYPYLFFVYFQAKKMFSIKSTIIGSVKKLVINELTENSLVVLLFSSAAGKFFYYFLVC